MQAGDVFTLPFFPNQENKQKGESRWAIVLEVFNDSYRIIPMTCQQHQQFRYSKTILIQKNSSFGIQMGITCDAMLIADREIVISKLIVTGKIKKHGTCPDELMDMIFEL